ncbi:putative DNA alkylation repair enzyme [Marinitoga piezophila KA3]|uniref:Putative DNA alkylation repair enzyme n=2 Tax=Marinitoga TaxID=160798 RepID=H2J3M5_MARPK|nr:MULTISPECIES: DNA alkylation repair protein [Marinitoga]AEX84669.1 putative DNA alkylation repair enzyme [Marinitoga piezophila KA3]
MKKIEFFGGDIMGRIEKIISEISEFKNSERAEHSQKYFKGNDGYGKGDKFLGIKVPIIRRFAKKYKDLDFSEIEKFLNSEYHEFRLLALFILTHKYKKYPDKVVEVYLKNIDNVNNWDLVDSSAPHILGAYLYEKDKSLLYDFAKSNNLWKQRIAILSTFYFIKRNDFSDALRISEILINHEHHLIHKAVGWMLREIGKRNKKVEDEFLKKYYEKMPRTMLRYAIEKYPETERKKYLKGEV